MIEASRPRRCPFPSMTMGVDEKVAIMLSIRHVQRDDEKGIEKSTDLERIGEYVLSTVKMDNNSP